MTLKPYTILLIFIIQASAKFDETYIRTLNDLAIEGVTLFPSEAEITHSVSLENIKGNVELVITDIPLSHIKYDTIRLRSTQAGVTVNGITFITGKEEEEKIRSQSEEIRREITALEKKSNILQQQKTRVSESKPSDKMTAEQLDEFFDLTQTRILKLEENISKISDQISELSQKRREVEKSLYKALYSMRIMLSIDSDTKTSARSLILQYVTTAGHWSPSYDLFYDPFTKKANLSYFAVITQQTGFDWDKVPITISTFNISDSATKLPSLKEVYLYPSRHSDQSVRITEHYNTKSINLNYQQTYQQTQSRGFGNHYDSGESQKAAVGGSSFSMDASEIPPEFSDLENEEEDLVETEMALPSTLILRSQKFGDSHKVLITTISLDLEITHFGIPKLSNRAYLKASTQNKSPFVLKPGKMFIFKGDRFAIQTTLCSKSIQPGQKFELNLGVDEAVQITYKADDKFKGTEGFISSKTVQHARIFISVTNNKKEDITISLKDQLPISTDDKISVNIIEMSDQFNLDQQTRFLRANMTVPAGQREEAHFYFTVSHPPSIGISTKSN